MSKRKVCANCKFYRDASCSHYWIDRPEQQTCDDFRQFNPAFEIFCMMNKLGEYKKEDAESDRKERTDMTDEQFRYLVKIVRQRSGEEFAKLTQAVKSGRFESVSVHAAKLDAFKEVTFWLHGMASDETEDAFK